MFIGYTVFFTKREIVQFITILMQAMIFGKSSSYVKLFSNVFYELTIAKGIITTSDYKSVMNAIRMMNMPITADVAGFMSVKSRPGSYYRPRHDPTEDDPKCEYGIARWNANIDYHFSMIARSVWSDDYEQVFTNMEKAGVDPKRISEIASYMKSRNLFDRSKAPVFQSMRSNIVPFQPRNIEITGRAGELIVMSPTAIRTRAIDFPADGTT